MPMNDLTLTNNPVIRENRPTAKRRVHLAISLQPPLTKTQIIRRTQSFKTSQASQELRNSSTSNSSYEAEDVRMAVRSEIYYDDKQMPRIETVRSLKPYVKQNEQKVKKPK